MDKVFNSGDPDAVEQLMKERLSSSPRDFLSLAYRKASLLWGSFEPTAWAFTGNVFRDVGSPEKLDLLMRAIRGCCIFAVAYYIFMNLFAGIGVLMIFKKKELNEAYMLLILIALAYFFAHTIIEVQVRYRSLMTAVTAPLMALGADAVLASVTKLKKTIRK